MKKALIPCILGFLFLLSCNNIVFDRPQPADCQSVENLNNIFPGIYISSDNDTLHVTKTSITLGGSSGNTITGKMGNNLDVKEYTNGYIVNLSDSLNGKLVWIPFLFKLNNDTLWINFSDFSNQKLAEIESNIKGISPYEVFKNENGEYKAIMLKPTKASEFNKLVEQGIFNKTVWFRMEKGKQ